MISGTQMDLSVIESEEEDDHQTTQNKESSHDVNKPLTPIEEGSRESEWVRRSIKDRKGNVYLDAFGQVIIPDTPSRG